MTLPQIVAGVLFGNAITAGILYCVWLSKRDPDSRKGYWIAMGLALLVALIGYAARR